MPWVTACLDAGGRHCGCLTLAAHNVVGHQPEEHRWWRDRLGLPGAGGVRPLPKQSAAITSPSPWEYLRSFGHGAATGPQSWLAALGGRQADRSLHPRQQWRSAAHEFDVRAKLIPAQAVPPLPALPGESGSTEEPAVPIPTQESTGLVPPVYAAESTPSSSPSVPSQPGAEWWPNRFYREVTVCRWRIGPLCLWHDTDYACIVRGGSRTAPRAVVLLCAFTICATASSLPSLPQRNLEPLRHPHLQRPPGEEDAGRPGAEHEPAAGAERGGLGGQLILEHDET